MGLEEKAQTREIDGRAFRAWPLPFGLGLTALVRLSGIVSPVLSSMFKGATESERMAGLFDALPAALSVDDVQYFARLFGDASHVKDGDNWVPLVEKNQAERFEGQYMAFFKWLTFCMEVNFSGFFDGVMKGGAGVDLAKMVRSTSK
jgi:hypothetical protein